MDDHELDYQSWNTSLLPPNPDTDLRSERPVAMLIVGISVSATVVVVNLFLAASLIAGRNFNAFTVCVFHMMALDMATGACVGPLAVSPELQGGVWTHGDVACSFWATLDNFLPALIIVTCALVHIERLLELSQPRYRLWRELWSWRHFIFVWVPWTAVLVVGVPLYVVGTRPSEQKQSNLCYVLWRHAYSFFFTVLLYFVPLFLTVVCLVAAVVCSIRATCTTYKDDAPRGTVSSAVALVLVTASVILMMLPSFILQFMSHWAGGEHVPPSVYMTLYWISLANSAVRPLCWLVDPEIRLGYVALFRKCCCRRSAGMPLHGASLTKA